MILGFCVIFLIVLILLLSKCEAIIYSNYKVFSLYMKLKQKLFFNSIIRFFMTSCIKLQLLAVDVLLAGFAITFIHVTKLAYAIFIFLSLYGLYAYLFIYMRKHRDILDKPSTRDKIGNLYEGLQVTTINNIPLEIEYYSLFFFLKRAIFVMITFSLYKYPGLQVMAFLQLTIFYLIYIGSVDFFKKKKKQWI